MYKVICQVITCFSGPLCNILCPHKTCQSRTLQFSVAWSPSRSFFSPTAIPKWGRESSLQSAYFLSLSKDHCSILPSLSLFWAISSHHCMMFTRVILLVGFFIKNLEIKIESYQTCYTYVIAEVNEFRFRLLSVSSER